MNRKIMIIGAMALMLLITGAAYGATITVAPTDTQDLSNCFPFGGGGGGWTPYMGFIYQNVPPFNLRPGDILAFDLGQVGNSDIQLDIAMAPAIGNGALNEGVPFTTIVTNTQTPQNPRGDAIAGNYELRFTVEHPFSFSGGGLIIRFSNPSATYALDNSCSQVLVNAAASDSSGFFVARFYRDDDGVSPWDEGATDNIGGFQITTQNLAVPAMMGWGKGALAMMAGLCSLVFLRRRRGIKN